MPNLYGTLLKPDLSAVADGTVVRFTRNQEISSGGILVWSGGRIETETDANGRFGPVSIAPGRFIAEWLNGYHQNRVEFEVPNSSRSWELGYLLRPEAFGWKIESEMFLLLNVDTGEYHPIDIDADGAFRVWSPETILTYPNYDIHPASNTFRLLKNSGTSFPLTWEGTTAEDDGTLVIGDANGVVSGGNYILNRWLNIRNVTEDELPYRQLFLVGSRENPTWALGSAYDGAEETGESTITGDDPTINTLTMRYGDTFYRMTITGESNGVPTVEWERLSSAGSNEIVNTLTLRFGDSTYRMEIVGETDGVPVVQWVKTA